MNKRKIEDEYIDMPDYIDEDDMPDEDDPAENNWLDDDDDDDDYADKSSLVTPNYGLPLAGHIRKADLNGVDQTARFVRIMAEYNSGDDKRQQKAKDDVLAELDALIKHVMSSHYNTYRMQHGSDLYAEGVLAVFQVLPAYNPEQSRPTVYFYLPIKHAMQVYVAQNVHHVSRHYADMTTKLKKAAAKIRATTGCTDVSPTKLSEYTKIPLSTVLEAMRQDGCTNAIPFDVDNENTISALHEQSPVEYVIEQEKVATVRKALASLSPLEARIICLRAGYGAERIYNKKEGAYIDSPTEKQIADYLMIDYPDLTPAKVHQLYSRGCTKLKKCVGLREYVSTVPYESQKRQQIGDAMPNTPIRTKKQLIKAAETMCDDDD